MLFFFTANNLEELARGLLTHPPRYLNRPNSYSP